MTILAGSARELAISVGLNAGAFWKMGLAAEQPAR